MKRKFNISLFVCLFALISTITGFAASDVVDITTEGQYTATVDGTLVYTAVLPTVTGDRYCEIVATSDEENSAPVTASNDTTVAGVNTTIRVPVAIRMKNGETVTISQGNSPYSYIEGCRFKY